MRNRSSDLRKRRSSINVLFGDRQIGLLPPPEPMMCIYGLRKSLDDAPFANNHEAHLADTFWKAAIRCFYV
jgi:hypothetical protein